jgi:hypothetical protein
VVRKPRRPVAFYLAVCTSENQKRPKKTGADVRRTGGSCRMYHENQKRRKGRNTHITMRRVAHTHWTEEPQTKVGGKRKHVSWARPQEINRAQKRKKGSSSLRLEIHTHRHTPEMFLLLWVWTVSNKEGVHFPCFLCRSSRVPRRITVVECRGRGTEV